MDNFRAPAVSAIVPARNEALNIECSVRSLAAQADIKEIIVVDDSSEDGTDVVLEHLKVPALHVIRHDFLPDGWMGKTYAAAEGAARARSEWLLFTDADTEHLPGSLSTLLARAIEEKVDLLSISPGQRVPTWWEKAVIPLIYTQLARAYPFDEVSDPAFSAAAANGQYILIRRLAYEQVGGHRAVRNEVLEDVALARRVKASGGKILFLPGAAWAATRMYCAFPEMWQGWTKNLFLLYGGTVKIMRAAAGLAAEWLAGVLLIVFALAAAGGPRVTVIDGAVGLLLAVVIWRFSVYRANLHASGFSAGLFKYFWLGAPILVLLLFNSLRAYRLGGAVQWKGRTYSVREVL